MRGIEVVRAATHVRAVAGPGVGCGSGAAILAEVACICFRTIRYDTIRADEEGTLSSSDLEAPWLPGCLGAIVALLNG